MEFQDYIQQPIEGNIIRAELQRSYPYYQYLTPLLQQRFIMRCADFIEQKKFVGRKELVITDRIRILISACAIQVTFGLDSYTISNFEYVIVYPDVYESPVTGKMHKGETNLNGFICFSWKDILEGIENPSDNYNLGLHEWTHALRFNSIKYDETDYFFDGYINKWVANAIHEFTRLKNGNTSIFRKYGATNIHEFFSVCIEHFFESPEEFRTKVPALFTQTCILLNQIPAKEASAQIDVRNQLMMTTDVMENDDHPLYSLQSSLPGTLFVFGRRLIYFCMALFFLLRLGGPVSMSFAFLLCLYGVVRFNNEYFTIRFYENHIYLQKGFIDALARKSHIHYYSLMKMQIYEGTYETHLGYAFELKYYDGARFVKRMAYSSVKNIPEAEIKTLLQGKNVAVLFSN